MKTEVKIHIFLMQTMNPSLLASYLFFFFCQGLDEEAIVDHGKTSFATLSNYEKDDFESKFKTARPQVFFLQLFLVLYCVMEM